MHKNNIVILGAGESGVGAALLAQANGYTVFVSDYGVLKASYRDELLESNILFEENGHTDENILAADLIVKSPGISDDARIVQQAVHLASCGIIEQVAACWCTILAVGVPRLVVVNEWDGVTIPEHTDIRIRGHPGYAAYRHRKRFLVRRVTCICRIRPHRVIRRIGRLLTGTGSDAQRQNKRENQMSHRRG